MGAEHMAHRACKGGAESGLKREHVEDVGHDHHELFSNVMTSAQAVVKQKKPTTAGSESSDEGESDDDCTVELPSVLSIDKDAGAYHLEDDGFDSAITPPDSSTRPAVPTLLELCCRTIAHTAALRKMVVSGEAEETVSLIPEHAQERIMQIKPVAMIPACMSRYLKQYQRDGVKWLWQLYKNNSGGILADEMGLGKTIQTICFLSAVFGKTGSRLMDGKRASDITKHRARQRKAWQACSTKPYVPPALLIMPASLIGNWEGELKRWGNWATVTYHSGKKAAALKQAEEGTAEIVITTFDTFKLNMTELSKIQWGLTIIDEVHNAKNHKSELYKAIHQLPQARRFGLTGTPIQNKYKELWTLFDVCSPGSVSDPSAQLYPMLNPASALYEEDLKKRVKRDQKWFRSTFSAAIKKGLMKTASPSEISRKDRAVLQLQDQVFAHHLLRREKAEVDIVLPHKEDAVVLCPLTPLQIKVYRRLLDSPDFEALKIQLERTEATGIAEDDELVEEGDEAGEEGDAAAAIESARGEWGYDRAARQGITWKNWEMQWGGKHQAWLQAADQGVIWKEQHMQYNAGKGPPLRCNPRCSAMCMLFPQMQALLKVCQHLDLLKPRPPLGRMLERKPGRGRGGGSGGSSSSVGNSGYGFFEWGDEDGQDDNGGGGASASHCQYKQRQEAYDWERAKNLAKLAFGENLDGSRWDGTQQQYRADDARSRQLWQDQSAPGTAESMVAGCGAIEGSNFLPLHAFAQYIGDRDEV
jgi:hypothetical protein